MPIAAICVIGWGSSARRLMPACASEAETRSETLPKPPSLTTPTIGTATSASAIIAPCTKSV